MTLMIDLSQTVEQALKEQAKVQRLKIEEYAKTVLEDRVSRGPQRADDTGVPQDEEERLLDELALVAKSLPASSMDESFSRESIYGDHD